MTATSLLPRRTFVLGGARSGKSRYAETLVGAASSRPCVIVTAEALDTEMSARIARHRADRDPAWTTIEAPRELAAALDAHTDPLRPILIDCLTLWLSNLLLDGRDIDSATAELLAAMDRMQAPLVIVSNEVGLGIVPDNALARRFRDAQGRLNQSFAARADRVVFLAAGLPLTLKP